MTALFQCLFLTYNPPDYIITVVSGALAQIPDRGIIMDHILRNLTEDIVISELDSMINKLDCCKCDKCRLDIASYALNRLPAKYIATTQGELMSKISIIDNDFRMRVATELSKGAQVVKKNPRHAAVPSTPLPNPLPAVIETK